MLTVAEVSERLHTSKYTVYRLVHSGELPAARVGRGFRVQEAVLDAYVTNGAPVHQVAAEQERLLNVSDVAHLLRCSRDTVRRLVASGDLSAIRNAGRNSMLRIHKSSVDAYLRRTPASASA